MATEPEQEAASTESALNRLSPSVITKFSALLSRLSPYVLTRLQLVAAMAGPAGTTW